MPGMFAAQGLAASSRQPMLCSQEAASNDPHNSVCWERSWPPANVHYTASNNECAQRQPELTNPHSEPLAQMALRTASLRAAATLFGLRHFICTAACPGECFGGIRQGLVDEGSGLLEEQADSRLPERERMGRPASLSTVSYWELPLGLDIC
jgi:hypothetical protein